MNLAAAASEQIESTVSQTVPVVVLGTDALLAAAPNTAVQLAHACLHAGYASVVPASWGDELVAAAVLRRLPQFGHGPAIQCSCPIVAHRLLTTGGDLRPVMLPLVSPPVALARYLRALSQPSRLRITYVGGCPGAVDESIDIRMSPETLIGMLAERQISVDDQPRVFESIIPPDRRRYFSQPGGLPSAERLWTDLGSRALVEVESDDFVSEIADHLLAGEQVLMDVAPRLGCVCSGALPGVAPREARVRVVAVEPPRSSAPVVEEQPPLDLDLPIPAVPRTPVDAVLAARTPMSSLALPLSSAPNRLTPTVTEPRPPRASPSPGSRPITGSAPTAKHPEGRPLPRAYVARRRQSTPKGQPVVTPPAKPSPAPEQHSPEESTNAAAPAGEADAQVDVTESAPEVVASVQPAMPGEERATGAVSATVTAGPPAQMSDDDAAASGIARDPTSGEVAAVQETTPETSEAPTPPEDRDQLHLDGIATPASERLPLFTPAAQATAQAEPAPLPEPANSKEPPPAAIREASRARLVLWILLGAVVILALAGAAYYAGRAARGPSAPTEQQH